MKKELFQQGDVLMERVERVPAGAKKLEHQVLAEGEATGHAHRSSTGVLFDDGPRRFLSVPKGGDTITHDEHNPVSLPEGSFAVRGVLEYDHFTEEARVVAD